MSRPLAKGEKPIDWIGSAKKDFTAFPKSVQMEMGMALGVAQYGAKHPSAKPLKGLGGGVFGIVESFDGNAYRAIYTVRFADRIYVLHAFQKKSVKGIATPGHEIELVKKRLRIAEEDAAKGKNKP
ncbi:MAG: hypothetical protein EPN26_06685 [Rhodospirillales bacterium]|nr:MAG: hypothetical protein EPN26_06685 [Rhodospirillales bacterium]